MSFLKIQEQDRRFHILYFLSQEPDFSLNHSMLHAALSAIGHGVDPDLVISDMSWLKTQGLVTCTEHQQYHVAKLTSRGQAVAECKMFIPGIKRTIMDV